MGSDVSRETINHPVAKVGIQPKEIKTRREVNHTEKAGRHEHKTTDNACGSNAICQYKTAKIFVPAGHRRRIHR